MPNYRRDDTKGGMYFFTVVTHRRQKLLCREMVRQALRAAIKAVRVSHPFTIKAWVLLPDHLHCIWTLPPGDADFSVRWSKIKRCVSRQCGLETNRLHRCGQQRKESSLWQRRFWEHRIRDEQDYRRHMDYLHYNPVKHGLVAQVGDWPYSTFHRLVRQGIYEPDWAGVVSGQALTDTGEP